VKISESNLLRKPYFVLACLFAAMAASAFLFQTPYEIARGYWRIITVPDRLVTDYIAVGGLGAALINASLSSLLMILLLIVIKHKPVGLTFGVIGLVCGFAFFGKNPVNMAPIVFGAFLHARYAKIPFSDRVLVAFCSTCLAPVLMQVVHFPISMFISIPLGVLIGAMIGFVIGPFAVWARCCHDGLNLYNVGFCSGIFAIMLMAIFRATGNYWYLVNIWSYGNNLALSIILAAMCVYLIIIGLLVRKPEHSLRELMNMKAEGYNYYSVYGGGVYISMGVIGLFALAVPLVLGTQLNGLIVGAVISIIGFGACGKKLRYIAPIFAGGILAAQFEWLTRGTVFQNPSIFVNILFSACLSPFSEEFGIKWAVVAGFVHVNLALSLGVMHGGMNLYNNGLAAGLTALILVPIVRGVRKQAIIKK